MVATEHKPRPEFVVITRGVAEASFGGRTLGKLGPGDHFGELTVFDGQPQVPTITALTDLEGFVLERRGFWSALRGIPDLSARLASRLAEDLRDAREGTARAG